MSILHKCFFSFIMLCVFILSLELLLIFVDPYLQFGFYQFDPDMGFRVRGHANGANLYGFNDIDSQEKKPEGVFRILVLGDSFCWAGRGNKNYTAKLEKKFKNHYGDSRIEVINAGYPMTHTGEQLVLLKKYGLLFEPDYVFLGFFCGNDFIDAVPFRKRIVMHDTIFDIDTRCSATIAGHPILLKSRFFSYLSQKLSETAAREIPKSQHTISQNISNSSEECLFTQERFLKIEKDRMRFCEKSLIQNGDYQANIDYIFQAILSMNELLKEKNVRFMIGILPDQFQVDDNLQKAVIDHFGMKFENFDFGFPQDILKNLLISQNIDFIDLLPPLQSQNLIHRVFLCRDPHWNEAGNETVAEELFQYLLPRMNLIGNQMD